LLPAAPALFGAPPSPPMPSSRTKDPEMKTPLPPLAMPLEALAPAPPLLLSSSSGSPKPRVAPPPPPPPATTRGSDASESTSEEPPPAPPSSEQDSSPPPVPPAPPAPKSTESDFTPLTGTVAVTSAPDPPAPAPEPGSVAHWTPLWPSPPTAITSTVATPSGTSNCCSEPGVNVTLCADAPALVPSSSADTSAGSSAPKRR
jgi:hypothetical protein